MPLPSKDSTPHDRQDPYDRGFREGARWGLEQGAVIGRTQGRAQEQREQTAEWLARADAAPTVGGRQLSWAQLEALRSQLPEAGSCMCPPCELRRHAVIRHDGDYQGRARPHRRAA